MSDEIDDLKNLWKNSRADNYSSPVDAHHIILLAKQKKSSAIKLQLGTVLILLITLAGIAAFFVYVAQFKQTVSHIGSGLMLGSLALRIVIELFSIQLFNKIDLSQTALKTNDASLKYFEFRRRINGPVTIAILIAYTIGFYMLTPEFSLYFSTPVLVMIDLSYILAAIIFTTFIRIGIKKEVRITEELLRIRKDLTEKQY